jgi:hypothetical protein
MSREDVIRQIVERDVQNLGLTEELVTLETPELYAAACEFYGTWDTALQYAGISERRVAAADLSKPEHVLRKIRQLCLDGYDLSASRNKERDRQLFNAARRHFGSWKQALRAVGMNLEQARPSSRPRSLNRDKIIEILRQRHEAGLSLSWSVVCLENRVFAVAAKQLFRSWRRALEAAGLLPERNATGTSRKWDRQTILDAIRRRQQEGKSLQCSRVREEEGGLVSAARRYFATWDDAVAAAIAPPQPI